MAATSRLLISRTKLFFLPIIVILVILYLKIPLNADKHSLKKTQHASLSGKSFRRLSSNRTTISMQTSSYLDNHTELVSKLSQRNYFQCNSTERNFTVFPNRTGYVLALNFHEQQTRASTNLFTLQCWAKTLFVNIVEPFVINSYFEFPMNKNQDMNMRFSDIFQIQSWQALTTHHHFAPLASWDQFIAKAPRKLIVVRFRYLTVKEHKENMYKGKEAVHLVASSDMEGYKEGCKASRELDVKISYMINELNFTIVRDVCLNFARGDKLTLSQFNRHIFGGIGPKTVTVVMEEWKGVDVERSGKRALILDSCMMKTIVQFLTYLRPSQQLLCDARKYREKHFRTKKYITLMVRTEKVDSLMQSADIERMMQCLNTTLQKWRELKKSSNIHDTFLAMDIGKYGSYSLMEHNVNTKYQPYSDLYAPFFREIFGADATIRTWEIGFEEVATMQDPGYIASLQKTIAMNSKCIIFTGGGSFQRHTKLLYERNNRNRKACTFIVQECSRGIT